MKGTVDSVHGSSTISTVNWFPSIAQASLKFQVSGNLLSLRILLPQLLHAKHHCTSLKKLILYNKFSHFFSNGKNIGSQDYSMLL